MSQDIYRSDNIDVHGGLESDCCNRSPLLSLLGIRHFQKWPFQQLPGLRQATTEDPTVMGDGKSAMMARTAQVWTGIEGTMEV